MLVSNVVLVIELGSGRVFSEFDLEFEIFFIFYEILKERCEGRKREI